jgi:hypothetical protein
MSVTELDPRPKPEPVAGKAFKWGFFVALGVAAAGPVIAIMTYLVGGFLIGFMGGIS